ncbi:MAG: VWA domain-containing protein [Planctomycetes bacterium]|nr:VWA domain-containing protein [Planctomycetota bacterium]
MSTRKISPLGFMTVLFTAHFLAPAGLPAQSISSRPEPPVPSASTLIVPQARSFAVPRPGYAQVIGVEAGVQIVEQVATTILDIHLSNPGGSRLEAELVVPVPDGAVVRGFSFQGAGSEPTARILPKEEARRTYEAIVRQLRDPAILEFLGYHWIRTSVFPVEPRGTQQVRLIYEHLLPADGNRLDYILPRSESVEYNVPWRVSVKIKSSRPISTAYSPSHKIDTVRLSPEEVSVRIAEDAVAEPGPFRLSYLLEEKGLAASLLAYPDPRLGGGYFLLLAGLPARPAAGFPGAPLKREVTLVLDRSGSMSGEKIEQVREAALQVIGGLENGEAFNVIVFNETVEAFSPEPVIKTEETYQKARAYLKGVSPRSGTNIHDALLEALRPKPVAGMVPIVLFLTDGLPTVGQTSEAAIRDVALKANPYQRRIFTFGVGVDVNSPLLERIAYETRATATFVLPKENVEVKVGQVFKKLSGPILADPRLEFAPSSPEVSSITRIREVIPPKLPDLFEGDQLVVLGQYAGEKPVTFILRGNYLGQERAFQFTFGFDKATARNAYVPRLWASRKIALLVDAIRQLRVEAPSSPGLVAAPGLPDPRIKELIDEIVRLSTEFGILTEYTSFLALEGTDLTRKEAVVAEAHKNFKERAVECRSGLGSVNQDVNSQAQKAQSHLNVGNRYYDQNMNRVAITTVQQVCDRAFYQKKGRWVDSRVVDKEKELQPRKVIEFGSEEYRRLAEELIAEGRQGCLALRGDVLLVAGGEPVLVKAPAEK